MVHAILVVVWTVLNVIGVILAGLIILVLIILCVPFGFEVLATRDVETRVDSRILLANIRIYSFSVWPARRARPKPQKAKEHVRLAAKPKDGRTAAVRPALTSRILSGLSLDLFAQVAHLLRRLWRSLRLRVSASGRFGASDPATTGMIYGAYEAVIRPFNISDTLRPCFDQPCLEGRVEVTGRVWPIGLLTDAFIFIFSKPVRQVWFPELKYLISRR